MAGELTMRILGIESSCDETGIAIYDDEKGLLAHQLYSQVKVHADYGGVVPELASRDHVRKTLPLIDAAFAQAGCGPEDLDGIAYTAGPGLVGALLVGTSIGRSLAYGWDIPAVAVHHMEGHLLAPMLEENVPEFPFIALLVSGGHTMMVKVAGIGQYEVLGESVDDAAGEAFDKTAKLLGLDYPGGPRLAKMAEQGVAKRFVFPRPMTDKPGLDFSFSGLKTAILYFIQKKVKENPNFIEENLADICASIQFTIISILMAKLKKAVKDTGITQVAIGGGVSANSGIRDALKQAEHTLGWTTYIPKFEYTTDNAGMIAITGYHKYLKQDFADITVVAKARLAI